VNGVAAVGYFVGIVGNGSSPGDGGLPSQERPAPPGDVLPAVAYAELREARRGPNRDWTSRLKTLVQPAPPVAPEDPPDPEVKQETLRQRESRRAYNGAPPVVPHDIDQLTSAACLSCHESAVRISDRTATRIPHPYMSSCTQCHVEADSSAFGPGIPPENMFAGLPAPFEGPRAWTGAPPLIPHSTLMRVDCLSCHGPTGPRGLRTTHPERQSCLQCHAPSARLDQYAAAEVPGRLPPPAISAP
jgi:cytochrome c-type protein NapB